MVLEGGSVHTDGQGCACSHHLLPRAVLPSMLLAVWLEVQLMPPTGMTWTAQTSCCTQEPASITRLCEQSVQGLEIALEESTEASGVQV